MGEAAPFLSGCYAVPERIPKARTFPFDLPFFGPEFDVVLDAPVVLLVGENGSGKSTLLESVAALCRLPAGGGGRTEALSATESSGARLATALRPRFRRRPRGGFFLRAETLFSLAETLEERERDPDFEVARGLHADPYAAYGGKSLHARSHGEALLAVLEHRMKSGLYLFDEPEAALSPRGQVLLANVVDRRVGTGDVQVLMATHSPLLMTLPGARLLLLDGVAVRPATVEETPHWQALRSLFEDRAAFWAARLGT